METQGSSPLLTIPIRAPSLPSPPTTSPASSQVWRDSPQTASPPTSEAPSSTPSPSANPQTGETDLEAQSGSAENTDVPQSQPTSEPQPDADPNPQPDVESITQIQASYEAIEPLKLSISYYAQLRTAAYSSEDIEGGEPKPAYGITHKKSTKIDQTPPTLSTTTFVKVFFVDVVFRQLYWHFLLRIPEVYWSRIRRILKDADIPDAEIAAVAFRDQKIQSSAASSRYTIVMKKAKDRSERFARLHLSWEHFLDSAMREWKIMNLVSVLLLGAIASLLQIQLVAADPLVRTAAFTSMMCALMSLLYGCMYSIRFFDLKKSYKSLQWAENAQRNQLNPFWNIWVFMAMPAIWLVWSLVAYLICLMAYIWRVEGDNLATKTPTRCILGLRIVVSCVLFLGLMYLCLIINALRQYGGVMEDKWQERMESLRRFHKRGEAESDPSQTQSVYIADSSCQISPRHSQLDLIEAFELPVIQDTMQPTWIQSGLSTVPDRAVLPAVQVIVGNNQLRSAMKRIDSRPSPRPHHVTFPDLKPVTDPYHEVDDKEDAPRPAAVSETIQDSNSREIDLGLTSTPSPQNSALTEPVQISAPRSGYSTPYPFPTGGYFLIAQRPWISGNPSSEYLRPPPCFSRPVPENMEERQSCFPSTKFISIDTVVTDDIDRIGFTAFKHDVGFGDWCEFIMDISPVIRAQCKNPDPQEEDLRLVINNWNDQFFSKRGLHMAFVTVSESPGYQHAIILCDATDPRPSSWGTVPLPSASKYTQAPSRPLLSLLEYMLHEADVSRGAHEVPTSSVLAPDITSTSPLLSGNDKNTTLEGPSTLPEASTPGTSPTMGDPSSPLVVPDALPIPFIEKEHKRFTRPVPDDLGSQPNFKTTRILSLNQGELKPINPLHASSRRDINSEDWGDFFKDIDGVVTQNSESNITTDIGKYYKDQLLPLLKSWNGQFFLKRGVQVICCTQYTRRGPLRSENFALYLRDIKPAARLAQGEFDSEEFMKVEILVDNAEDDDDNFDFIPRGKVNQLRLGGK